MLLGGLLGLSIAKIRVSYSTKSGLAWPLSFYIRKNNKHYNEEIENKYSEIYLCNEALISLLVVQP